MVWPIFPILLLSFVFFTFSLTDLLGGNGYLAVYIAGMMVGNARIMHRKEINTFMDGLTWLFQIIMFLCLGLLVNPHEMIEVALVADLIAGEPTAHRFKGCIDAISVSLNASTAEASYCSCLQ